MSYYTTYRPQTIEALDLNSVRSELSKILRSGTFSQAYVFTGPKGTGKTSSARIVAKLVNCEQNRVAVARWLDTKKKKENKPSVLVEPCNECESCRRITNGSSLACVEMDAASNRGIDDVRSLRERVGLAPVEGLMMVYIIDEVHMLTAEAFNALLKTLEEPPNHVMFILCTTETHKIPETVLSRCTQINFSKATPNEVVRSLKKAVDGESISIEKTALARLAALVDGSFRDGMKTLEQLVQAGTAPISTAMVEEALGYGGLYETDELLDRLLAKDMKASLALVASRIEDGVDVEVWLKRIVERVRERLLQSLTNALGDQGQLLLLAELLEQSARGIKQAPVPELVLELAVGRWCLGRTEDDVDLVEATAAGGLGAKQKPKRKELEGVSLYQQVERNVFEKESGAVAADKKKVSAREKPLVVGEVAMVVDQWEAILAAVRPLNHSLEALLRSTRPVSLADGCLTMEAFYAFHKEQLEQQRHRQKLEQAIGEVLGGAVRLKFVLGKRTSASSRRANVDVANISGAVDDQVLVDAAEEIFG